MPKILTFVLGMIVFVVAVGAPVHRYAQAFVTEEVVIDPATGVAIYGYDPVAFFIRKEAIKGDPQFEVTFRGATWIFENAANAERFQDAPEIYAPQFNGFGAHAVADGRATEGNPLIWAIFQNRLFFFYSDNARRTWIQNPSAYVEAAVQNWSDIKTRLSR